STAPGPSGATAASPAGSAAAANPTIAASIGPLAAGPLDETTGRALLGTPTSDPNAIAADLGRINQADEARRGAAPGTDPALAALQADFGAGVTGAMQKLSAQAAGEPPSNGSFVLAAWRPGAASPALPERDSLLIFLNFLLLNGFASV